MPRKIVLIGFSGAGKSAVAELLAKKLGCSTVDIDQEVEKAAGRSISEIIEVEGKDSFRDKESKALSLALANEAAVIATGGGILLREENRGAIFNWGRVVHLKVSAEVAAKRIEADESKSDSQVRPLIDSKSVLDSVKSLMKEREGLYDKADITVDVDNRSVEEVVEEIVNQLS